MKLKGPYLLFNYCGYHGHNEELLHGHTRGVDHTDSELTVIQITDEDTCITGDENVFKMISVLKRFFSLSHS